MLRIVPGADLVVDAQTQRIVTSGRGSLSGILGDAACRERLLGSGIHWDRVLVALDQDQPVGFAAFKYRLRGPFALRLEPFLREFGYRRGLWRFALFLVTELREWRYSFLLCGLKVKPKARNRGVGAALLNAVIEHAKANGYGQVQLEVHVDNERALRLYRSHGFSAGLQPLLQRLFGWPRLSTMSKPLR